MIHIFIYYLTWSISIGTKLSVSSIRYVQIFGLHRSEDIVITKNCFEIILQTNGHKYHHQKSRNCSAFNSHHISSLHLVILYWWYRDDKKLFWKFGLTNRKILSQKLLVCRLNRYCHIKSNVCSLQIFKDIMTKRNWWQTEKRTIGWILTHFIGFFIQG